MIKFSLLGQATPTGIPGPTPPGRLPGRNSPPAVALHLARVCLLTAVCTTAPTAAVQADEILFQLPPGAGVGENWLCRAEADSQGSWFIRCEDLVEVFNYDPVLTNATEPQVATRIPLYGAPYHDSDLDGLASAVLCNQAPACRVALAMR